jgi:exopolyphosphatase/guanosine-5'-triphosphate,3'-diphosphate pyrophosphatase
LAPQEIQAFATSAVRSAKNGEAFVADMYANLGLSIQVLDGKAEAEYIFKGVWASGAGQGLTEPLLVMDIGGGSVEFILGSVQGEVLWLQSFEVGGQRLVDAYMQQDPIAQSAAHQLKTDLRQILQPLAEACALYKPKVLAGASGTFDTLRHLEYGTVAPLSNPSWKGLSIPHIYTQSAHLQKLNRAERLNMEGISELRADMIVVALLLLETALEVTGVQEIRQSSWALKEGVAVGLG